MRWLSNNKSTYETVPVKTTLLQRFPDVDTKYGHEMV
jgi:hypothetical protein